MTLQCGIYEIRNLVNDHKYIGSTTNFKKRWWRHLSLLRQGTHPTPHLLAAWKKYGEKVFEFRPLIFCDTEMLLWWEQRFLNMWKPEYNHKSLVNSSFGLKRSDETRKRISESKRGKPWNASPEVREANRVRMLGNTVAYGNKNHLGHTHSEETKTKIKAARVNQVFTEESRLKQSETLKQHYVNGEMKNAKLNMDKAHDIREKYTNGVRMCDLVKEYDVAKNTLYRVIRGETWVEVNNATA